jgi:two-component sensor histidine kinase
VTDTTSSAGAHAVPTLDQRIGRALLSGRDDEGVVVVEDGQVVTCTTFAAKLLRCDAAKVLGPVETFFGGLEGDVLQLQFRSLLIDGAPAEFVAPRPSAVDEWIEVRALPLAPGVAFLIRDVTGREQSDRTLRMLVHELNHRVKNMLATVQSVARQSLVSPQMGEPARDFEDRLMALAWTYDLLTRERWAGAPLREVIERTLAPHITSGSSRLIVEGPEVWLNPNRAMSMAMAVHELATNAVKYGAFSRRAGRVAVRWSLEDHADHAQLELEWSETGGPPVSPPRRRGFGSRLIERSLARELGGEVRLAFEPAGLRCLIVARLDAAGART